ncbi:hypothetical protein J1N35_015004 [Gossypium stocksii]|uniref:Uncharacterized protein n=1 Tax=Gossypium stocksii TaxID=47602 RepID=A0A9D3VWE8_9ROSI|nr:hypothetical protein J1N35_015004 [Gossypium stocksii]
MKHAVLSTPRTGALGALYTHWTRVWMACRVRGPFSGFLECMRSETVIFPMFLRVGSITLPCELGLQAGPTTLLVSSHKVNL